jgi:hypothetical protein
MAAVLAAYNAWCFGSPFSFSYAHLGYEDFATGSSGAFSAWVFRISRCYLALDLTLAWPLLS